jgi:hypothetical protein
MKIRALRAELFWAEWMDRRTDRHDESNSRFSQCCEKRLKGGGWNIIFEAEEISDATRQHEGSRA